MNRTAKSWRLRAGLTRADLIFSLAVLAAAAAGVGGYYFFVVQSRPQYRFQLAQEAIRNKDYKALRAEALRLEDLPAYESHYHYLMGMYRLMTARTMLELRDADTELDLAILANDGDTRTIALAARSEVVWRLHDPGLASQMATAVLKEDPQNTDALRVLAAVYYDLGAYDLALQYLLTWGKVDLDDVRPNFMIGQIYRDRGEEIADLNAAEANFREGIDRLERQYQSKPPKTDLDRTEHRDLKDDMHLALAETCIKKNTIEDALKACEVFSLDDDAKHLVDCLAVKAQCLHKVGDTREAILLLTRALKVNSNHLGVLLLRAEIHDEAEEYQEALALLLKLVQAHPSSYPGYFRLKEAYIKLGEKEKAEDADAKLRNLEKKLKRQGELNVQAGIEPKNAEIRFELGKLALELGQPELAISWFRAVLALDPKHEDALSEVNKLQTQSQARPGLPSIDTFSK